MGWIYDAQSHTWHRTIGEWKATVLRIVNTTPWYAIIEHTAAPYEQYESPEFNLSEETRAWCEREIAKRLVGG